MANAKAIEFVDMVKMLVDIRDDMDRRYPGRMVWVKKVEHRTKNGMVVAFSITLETPDGDKSYRAIFAKDGTND